MHFFESNASLFYYLNKKSDTPMTDIDVPQKSGTPMTDIVVPQKSGTPMTDIVVPQNKVVHQ